MNNPEISVDSIIWIRIYQPTDADEIADNVLCLDVKDAMKEKLKLSRAKGRFGWWRESCSIDYLKRSLKEHVEKGDMVDVINLAGMIYIRENVEARLTKNVSS